MANVDWGASGLRHRWWVDVLDMQRQRLNLLDGVTSMSISQKAGAAVRGSGQITVELQDSYDLLELTSMARIWLEVTDPVGNVHTQPLLTGLMESGSTREGPLGQTLPVDIKDPTARLDPVTGQELSVPAGTNVSGKIREWLTFIGVDDPQLTETGTVTRTAMHFGADETWRSVINTLGDVAGYAACWADEWGTIQVHPYVAPQHRPTVDLWQYGPGSTMLPEFTVEWDHARIPNHLVRISKADQDVAALRSEIRDYDSVGWGFYARGMWVADVKLDVDAADQATLDAITVRDWRTARSRYRRWIIDTRWRPVRLGDRIRLRTGPGRDGDTPAGGWDRDLTLQGWEIKADAGQPLDIVQATLDEVRPA